jgi:hypothetical protein
MTAGRETARAAFVQAKLAEELARLDADLTVTWTFSDAGEQFVFA